MGQSNNHFWTKKIILYFKPKALVKIKTTTTLGTKKFDFTLFFFFFIFGLFLFKSAPCNTFFFITLVLS